jgi:histidinol-phosphate aminotransferase
MQYTAKPRIYDLQPYLPGKSVESLALERDIAPQDIVKLASNENPYGASPAAAAAARQSLSHAHAYPDAQPLRSRLSAHYHLGEDQIVLGNGSNDVLAHIATVFLGSHTAAVSSQYGFAVYGLLTRIAGAANIVVPARDFGHDLGAMAAAVTPETRVIWISNPNNPTGTFVPYAQVKQFLARIPERVIVVLDEAYLEYLAPADRGDATRWLAQYPNLIIIRTFSKIYGLAGLRVGYGLGSAPVIDLLNRVRQPFNVSSVALAAAAAALADQAFVAQGYERNRAGLVQLAAGLDALGIKDRLPIYGNFVTIRVDDAPAVNEALQDHGVIVRPLAEYGLPDHLRVSVGTPAGNTRFLAAMKSALERVSVDA